MKLSDCRSCGGLIPQSRAVCPHCGSFVRPVSSRTGGLVAAVGLGASLVGCGGSGSSDAGIVPVADYGIAILSDAGPTQTEDAGLYDAGPVAMADYGIASLPDAGPGDTGDLDAGDAGNVPDADYGIVALPDAGEDGGTS